MRGKIFTTACEDEAAAAPQRGVRIDSRGSFSAVLGFSCLLFGMRHSELRRSWRIHTQGTRQSLQWRAGISDEGRLRRIPNLRRHLDLDDVVLDGIDHQITDRVQA
jgi:hypothetical protein